jgi:DNA repair protein RadC
MYVVARRPRRKRREHPAEVPVLGCRVHLVREAEIPWAGSAVTGPQDVYDLVRPMIEDRDREHLVALYLDIKNRPLGIHTVSIGCIASTLFEPRGVFTPALLCNAAHVVIAHNHPSGDPTPSPDDIRCAHSLRQAGELLGVTVLDFVIVGHGTFQSLKQRGDI